MVLAPKMIAKVYFINRILAPHADCVFAGISKQRTSAGYSRRSLWTRPSEHRGKKPRKIYRFIKWATKSV